MNAPQNIKKKILFILPALTAGGAERVLITLMNNLDRSAFIPSLLSISNEGALHDMIDKNISYHTFDIKRVLKSIPKLYCFIKNEKPDIILSTMAHMNFCLLVLKPFFPHTKFIVREAIMPSYLLNVNKNRTFILKAAYKSLYPMANKVISPAKTIIDEFDTLLKMDTNNHHVLLNPVNLDKVRADAKHAEFNIEEQKTIRFVSSGRLNYQKGFDRLIVALKDFKPEYKWRLHIWGEGQEKENLTNLIKKYNLEQHIFLRGFTKNPWPEYAKADCFLMPSRSEGLPNVILESLACGTPAIATKESGGIKEIQERAGEKNVIIVSQMDEFISKMNAISPKQKRQYEESLLPDDFTLYKVMKDFTNLILK